MKPESWTSIPSKLLETILWDIDSLDYEPYESSKAECINDTTNENVSDINRKIIDAYWKALSNEQFDRFVHNELDAAKALVDDLWKYLN